MHHRSVFFALGLCVTSAAACKPPPSTRTSVEPRDAHDSAAADVASSNALVSDTPSPAAASLAQQSQVARSLNAFGFSLFAALDRSENTLISPLDLGRALSLLELGADGESRAELDRALRFDDASRSIDALPALRQSLERSAQRPGFALSSGARVWPATSITVLDSYRDAAARALGAPIVALDYAADPEAQRRTINAWVSQQTRTRIPELLGPGTIDQQSRFVLTTALYFLGRWRATFDPSSTRDEPFFVGEGRAKTVPMMSGPIQARYAQDTDVRLLELDYEGGELVMDVMIPTPGRTLASIAPRLTADNFARWVEIAREQGVIVNLPRFTARRQSRLRGALGAIGVRSVFSSSANLERLTRAAPITIGDVIHEVFVSVNESGTEAAAATAVTGYGSGGGTPVFSVNQPFVFAIRHRPTGAVLFLGSVVDPAPEAAAQPTRGAPFEPGAADSMRPTFGPGLMGRSARGPMARAAPPVVQGALSPEAVRRVVLRSLNTMLFCHERGLATNSNLEGRVRVSFSITEQGAVRGATTDAEYPLPEVRECVRRVFERLTFPRPERGEASVEYPIVFLRAE